MWISYNNALYTYHHPPQKSKAILLNIKSHFPIMFSTKEKNGSINWKYKAPLDHTTYFERTIAFPCLLCRNIAVIVLFF